MKTVLYELFAQGVTQTPLVQSIRTLPGIGSILRQISHVLVSDDDRFWVTVREGPGQGLELYIAPRFHRNYWNGAVESEVQQSLQQFLKPGMVVYDVGAHIGFFSLIAARLVGPTGTVIAFEANPTVVEYTRLHRDRNACNHMYVLGRAVWSANQDVCFDDGDSSMINGMGHIVTMNTPNTIVIPTITLDDISTLFAPPDFIKMDIEGAEIEALKGAEHVFTTLRPILLCELHGSEAAAFVSAFLERHQYTYQWMNVYATQSASHILALPNDKRQALHNSAM